MKKIIYILILLSTSTALQAQEYMTLIRAREMAMIENEDLQIANHKLEKSTAIKKAARSNYFPSISASATGMYLKDNFETEMYLPTATPDISTGELVPNVMTNPATGQPVIGADGNPVYNMYAFMPVEVSLQGAYMAGITVEQPLFTGGKIIAGNKMAEIAIETARENIEIQKMNTISNVDNAYWLYVAVQSKVKLANSSVDMLMGLLERVQNSYDVGMVNRNEVLKVQVEYDKAILDLQKAKSGLELTRMSLCRLTGLEFDTQITTDSTIIFSDEIFSQFGTEDVTLRPEYQLLQNLITIEEQRIKTIQADYLPSIGVSAGYNYIGGIEFNGSDYNKGFMNLMFRIEIPLFNWGEGKQNVLSAKVDKKIKELELEKNTQLFQLEIENVKLNLRDAYFRIEISVKSLKQAQENLRVSNNNYEVGRELLTDLLIARAQWSQAFDEVIKAKIEYKLQETEYLRVTSNLIIE